MTTLWHLPAHCMDASCFTSLITPYVIDAYKEGSTKGRIIVFEPVFPESDLVIAPVFPESDLSAGVSCRKVEHFLISPPTG